MRTAVLPTAAGGLPGEGSIERTWWSSWFYRCSIGFRSGKLEGQGSTWKSWSYSFNYCRTDLATWHVSLSCWKVPSALGKTCMYSCKWSARMDLYTNRFWSAFIWICGPREYHTNILQTITLTPPACVIPQVVIIMWRDCVIVMLVHFSDMVI